MTMLNTNVRNVYISIGTSVFAYTFKIYEDTHIKVIVTDSDGSNVLTKTLNVDYTVSGVGNDAGGNVTFTSTVIAGKKVILILNTPLTQATDLVTADTLPAETLEKSLDYLASEILTLKAIVHRAVLLPESTVANGVGLALPDYNITTNQGKHLKLTASGIDIATVGTDAIANPLTTKGDLLGRDATAPVRVPVGTNGQVLLADSTDARGVKWVDPSTISGLTTATLVDSLESVHDPIVNPLLHVWQRGTSFAFSGTSAAYTADGWSYSHNNAGAVTISRSTDVPTVGQADRLLPYSIEALVTTPDSSMDAGDYARLDVPIEGYDWALYAQQDLYFSFWMKAPVTGNMAVTLRNGVDRSYVGTVTITVANSWQFYVVSFPASPSAGTWNYTNGAGAILTFVLMAGASFQTAGGTWISGALYALGGAINGLATLNNTFRFADIFLTIGTNVSHIRGRRHFPDTLLRCKRYYQKSFDYAVAPAQNTGSQAGCAWFGCYTGASTLVTLGGVYFPVSLRTTPAITLYNPNAANAQIRNASNSTDFSGSTPSNPSQNSFLLQGTTSGTTASTHACAVHWTADASI